MDGSARFGSPQLPPVQAPRSLGAANDDRTIKDAGNWYQPHDQFFGEVTNPVKRVDRALSDGWAIIAPRTERSSLLVVDRTITPNQTLFEAAERESIWRPGIRRQRTHRTSNRVAWQLFDKDYLLQYAGDLAQRARNRDDTKVATPNTGSRLPSPNSRPWTSILRKSQETPSFLAYVRPTSSSAREILITGELSRR